MKLRHIEIFNAVYAVGSVSGAAKFLNITQPTVSKLLMRAEEQAGFKLFSRVRGRLLPTGDADILYRETRKISEQVTSLQKTTQNLREADKGRLRLSSISALGLEYLPKAIVLYQQRHPDIRFEIQTRHFDNLLSGLRDNDKDIGIAFNAQYQKGFDSINLGSAEFVCIYANSEFDDAAERIRIQDIAKKPFVSIENSGPLGDLLNKMLVESGVSLQTNISAQTYFVALNLVAMGGGVAIVDEFTARSSGIGDVKYKAFDPPIRFSIQALHTDTNPPSKLARSFLDFFKKELLSKRQ